MCGIVGAVSKRDIIPVLLHGLNRLEYRGYDSAGVAVLDNSGSIQRVRAVGKIKNLEAELLSTPADGFIGIGHTRWATHGEPTANNAHPHVCNNCVAIVHNGIIEIMKRYAKYKSKKALILLRIQIPRLLFIKFKNMQMKITLYLTQLKSL